MAQPVVHFEIGCRNLPATRDFYSKIFGWEYAGEAPNMAMVGNLGPYAPTPTTGIGGHLTALGHEPFKYVTFYIQVPDIEATLAQIATQGGTTLIPKTEVPNMGHFAWFNDPEGNAIGLWTPMISR